MSVSSAYCFATWNGLSLGLQTQCCCTSSIVTGNYRKLDTRLEQIVSSSAGAEAKNRTVQALLSSFARLPSHFVLGRRGREKAENRWICLVNGTRSESTLTSGAGIKASHSVYPKQLREPKAFLCAKRTGRGRGRSKGPVAVVVIKQRRH